MFLQAGAVFHSLQSAKKHLLQGESRINFLHFSRLFL